MKKLTERIAWLEERVALLEARIRELERPDAVAPVRSPWEHEFPQPPTTTPGHWPTVIC